MRFLIALVCAVFVYGQVGGPEEKFVKFTGAVDHKLQVVKAIGVTNSCYIYAGAAGTDASWSCLPRTNYAIDVADFESKAASRVVSDSELTVFDDVSVLNQQHVVLVGHSEASVNATNVLSVYQDSGEVLSRISLDERVLRPTSVHARYQYAAVVGTTKRHSDTDGFVSIYDLTNVKSPAKMFFNEMYATGAATHTMIDMDSLVWIVGYTSTKIANSANTIVGGEDIFIARYRLDGFPMFVRMFGSPKNDKPVSVIIQEDFSTGGVDIVVAYNCDEDKSMSIVRVNGEGHMVFHKTFPNVSAKSLEYVIGRVIVVASTHSESVTGTPLSVFSIDFFTGDLISQSCVSNVDIPSNAVVSTTRRFYDVYAVIATAEHSTNVILYALGKSNICSGSEAKPIQRPNPMPKLPESTGAPKVKSAVVIPWVVAIVIVLLAAVTYAVVQYLQTKDKFKKLEELEHGNLEDDIEGLRHANELADRHR